MKAKGSVQRQTISSARRSDTNSPAVSTNMAPTSGNRPLLAVATTSPHWCVPPSIPSQYPRSILSMLVHVVVVLVVVAVTRSSEKTRNNLCNSSVVSQSSVDPWCTLSYSCEYSFCLNLVRHDPCFLIEPNHPSPRCQSLCRTASFMGPGPRILHIRTTNHSGK